MASMRVVGRAVAGVGLAAMLAGAAAAQQVYRSDEHGFSVATHPGWTVEPVTGEGITRLRTRSTANPSFLCAVYASDEAVTRNRSQAALDRRLTQPFAERQAREFFNGLSGATIKDILVTVEQRGGRRVGATTAVVAVRGKNYIFQRIDVFRPGRWYTVLCHGPHGAVVTRAYDFETVLNSFRPH